MFTINKLQYRYPKAKTVQLQIPHWTVNQAEHWLLLGKSGSGKSTLLHLLGGLLKPQAGFIEVLGSDLTQLSGSRLDYFRSKNIGFIFQKTHFIATLTILQNLLVAQYLAGTVQDKKRCLEILDEFGLIDKHKRYPSELSQGELQRVAVIRAVLNKPSLLLADEPTASLDDENAHSVARLLQKVANQTTLIIATHDNRLKTLFSKVFQLSSN